jgi:hypothetical protein
MKSITPVISIILLVLITIIASVSAFFFINSNVSDLEAQGNLDTNPVMDNSRLNLVSITGSKAIVRNDGTSPVTEVVMFVNNELLNYTLDTPILPGELKEINYTAREEGEDLEIKIIYNSGKTTQAISPARLNTEASGFDNTPNIFYDYCGEGAVIVNWNNTISFSQSDIMTCGCDSNLGGNIISNYGFETGDVTGWTSLAAGAGSYSISSSTYYQGDYSAYVSGGNPSFSDMGMYYQQVSDIGKIDFYANGNKGVGFGYYGIVVSSGGLPTDNGANKIYYAINEVGFSALSYCNAFPSNNIYVFCLTGYLEDIWENVIIYPENDFLEKYGSFDESELYVGVIAQGLGTGYFDNIKVYDLSTGEYCEDGNLNGEANGVCYNNECIEVYIGDAGITDFFSTANADISSELINFADSISCNLEIDESNYVMTVGSSTVSKTVDQLGVGEFIANISCIGDGNFMYKTFNVTSDYLLYLDTYTFSGNGDFDDGHMSIGEYIESNPGTEIIQPGKYELLVLSAAGNILVNFSGFNGYLNWREPGETDVDLAMSSIADLNQDGHNDILIKESKHFYAYDHEQNLLMNITEDTYRQEGYVIADINITTSGLEILNYDINNGELNLFNSTGGIIWTYSTVGINQGSNKFFGPAWADVTSTNTGNEIVFTTSEEIPNERRIVMLNASGDELYNYSIFTSEYMYLTTPAIGEIDASSDGLEIAVELPLNSTTNVFILLNSTLGQIWNYTVDNTDMNELYSPLIGDITGNGDKEILFYIQDVTETNPGMIYLFDKDGNLLASKSFKLQEPLILSEVIPLNNGLEILGINAEDGTLVIMDSSLNSIFISNVIVGTGFTLTDDVDNDGYLEVVACGENNIVIFETLSTATTSNWPTYHQNNNRTGTI